MMRISGIKYIGNKNRPCTCSIVITSLFSDFISIDIELQ